MTTKIFRNNKNKSNMNHRLKNLTNKTNTFSYSISDYIEIDNISNFIISNYDNIEYKYKINCYLQNIIRLYFIKKSPDKYIYFSLHRLLFLIFINKSHSIILKKFIIYNLLYVYSNQNSIKLLFNLINDFNKTTNKDKNIVLDEFINIGLSSFIDTPKYNNYTISYGNLNKNINNNYKSIVSNLNNLNYIISNVTISNIIVYKILLNYYISKKYDDIKKKDMLIIVKLIINILITLLPNNQKYDINIISIIDNISYFNLFTYIITYILKDNSFINILLRLIEYKLLFKELFEKIIFKLLDNIHKDPNYMIELNNFKNKVKNLLDNTEALPDGNPRELYNRNIKIYIYKGIYNILIEYTNDINNNNNTCHCEYILKLNIFILNNIQKLELELNDVNNFIETIYFKNESHNIISIMNNLYNYLTNIIFYCQSKNKDQPFSVNLGEYMMKIGENNDKFYDYVNTFNAIINTEIITQGYVTNPDSLIILSEYKEICNLMYTPLTIEIQYITKVEKLDQDTLNIIIQNCSNFYSKNSSAIHDNIEIYMIFNYIIDTIKYNISYNEYIISYINNIYPPINNYIKILLNSKILGTTLNGYEKLNYN